MDRKINSRGVAVGYLLMSLTLTMLPYGPSNNFFLLMLGLVAARLDTLDSGSDEAAEEEEKEKAVEEEET